MRHTIDSVIREVIEPCADRLKLPLNCEAEIPQLGPTFTHARNIAALDDPHQLHLETATGYGLDRFGTKLKVCREPLELDPEYRQRLIVERLAKARPIG